MTIFKLVMQEVTKEVPSAYNGGGGKKAPAPAPAPAIQTTTQTPGGISNLLSGAPETLDETDSQKKEKGINRKKMGTRGLRIPLQAKAAPSQNTPSSTGVQL